MAKALTDRLADLAKLERILAETVARCSGDPAPSCSVLDMLSTQKRA
jgi:MerR family mercuric resistance operon transcriptional regulator